MANVQSAKEFNAETPNVKFTTSVEDRQVPLAVGLRSHQYEIGLHWKITIEVYATPTTADTTIISRIIQTWTGMMVMRNKKKPTATLSIQVAMV